jgi:hypothetical protein
MSENWITEEDKFQLFTILVQRSVKAGVLKESQIKDEFSNIVEQGITQDIIKRDKLTKCASCDKAYSFNEAPASCDICGNSIEEGDSPDIIQYYTTEYPSLLKSAIGEINSGYEIKYHTESVEELSVEHLHRTPSENKYLHISPFFTSFDKCVQMYPNYNDLFVNWRDVPKLVTSPEEVKSKGDSFFHQEDDMFVNESSLLAEKIDEELEVEDRLCDFFWEDDPTPTSWYTLLSQQGRETADKRSDDEFNSEYSEMFEKFGMEFLHVLFPHAKKFHLAGKNKPDGFLQLTGHSYIVEAKTTSNEFKIFDEQDKATRYVDQIVTNPDYNPTGYIFIANEFHRDRSHKDIKRFIRRNINTVNLNIVCVNDEMMKHAVDELSDFYRREPSATHRIYQQSKNYGAILDQMSEITENKGVTESEFENIVKSLKELGEEPTGEEQVLDEIFSPTSKFEDIV